MFQRDMTVSFVIFIFNGREVREREILGWKVREREILGQILLGWKIRG